MFSVSAFLIKWDLSRFKLNKMRKCQFIIYKIWVINFFNEAILKKFKDKERRTDQNFKYRLKSSPPICF